MHQTSLAPRLSVPLLEQITNDLRCNLKKISDNEIRFFDRS